MLLVAMPLLPIASCYPLKSSIQERAETFESRSNSLLRTFLLRSFRSSSAVARIRNWSGQLRDTHGRDDPTMQTASHMYHGFSIYGLVFGTLLPFSFPFVSSLLAVPSSPVRAFSRSGANSPSAASARCRRRHRALHVWVSTFQVWVV